MPRGKKQHSQRETLFYPQWGWCWFHGRKLPAWSDAKRQSDNENPPGQRRGIKKKRSKDLARVLQYLINIIWLELFDWLWRQSQRHLESRLQNKSARLLQAPFSPPFQSLFFFYFNSVPKLSISPVPLPNCSSLLFDVWICWCSWVMSHCAKWRQLRRPFPLFSANPPLKQIMQSKKGSFQQRLSRRCLQTSLNAEAVGAAAVNLSLAGQTGGRRAGRRGEDALLEFKTQHQNWDREGIEVTASLSVRSAGIFTRNHRHRVYRQRSGKEEIYRKKLCTYSSVKSK